MTTFIPLVSAYETYEQHEYADAARGYDHALQALATVQQPGSRDGVIDCVYDTPLPMLATAWHKRWSSAHNHICADIDGYQPIGVKQEWDALAQWVILRAGSDMPQLPEPSSSHGSFVRVSFERIGFEIGYPQGHSSVAYRPSVFANADDAMEWVTAPIENLSMEEQLARMRARRAQQ